MHNKTLKGFIHCMSTYLRDQLANIWSNMFIRMADVQGKLSPGLLWMTENDASFWRKGWVEERGGEEKRPSFNRKQLLWGFALCWFTVRGEFTGTGQTSNITLTLSPSFLCRTRSDTTCLCTVGLSVCRMRVRGRVPGGCLTPKAARAASRLAAEPPPWTTTASLPRAEDVRLRKR